ncbi:hypothetical protein Ancab_007227 [Ancistrocladus abbreviatus]
MALTCISSSVNKNPQIPIVRTPYTDLHGWSESDTKFMKSMVSGGYDGSTGGGVRGARVLDGRSCRQMYFRSYTFSRKEYAPKRIMKCLERAKDRALLFLRSGSLVSFRRGNFVMTGKARFSCWCL